jgi:hypothetical protein
MAITYPLSLPTAIGMEAITLKADNSVAVSQSPFTGDQQVLKYPREMWSASVVIPPVHKDLAEPWVAFLLSLRGSYGTFYLNDPLRTEPQGAARDTDTITVDGAVSSGSSITIDTDQNSVTDYLKAGDYISIGSGTNTQLFKVLQDVDTNSTGGCTLDVWPNVRTSISDAATVTVESAKGVFRLSGNTQEWQINLGNSYGIRFDAMEAI